MFQYYVLKPFPYGAKADEAEAEAEANIPCTLCSTIKMNKHRSFPKAGTITHLK